MLLKFFMCAELNIIKNLKVKIIKEVLKVKILSYYKEKLIWINKSQSFKTRPN